MASADDRMTYQGYFKLLSCRTGLHQIVSPVPNYANVHKISIKNTVSISQLTRIRMEERP